MTDLTPEALNNLLDAIYPSRVYARYSEARNRLEWRKRILLRFLELKTCGVILDRQRQLVAESTQKVTELDTKLDKLMGDLI